MQLYRRAHTRNRDLTRAGTRLQRGIGRDCNFIADRNVALGVFGKVVANANCAAILLDRRIGRDTMNETVRVPAEPIVAAPDPAVHDHLIGAAGLDDHFAGSGSEVKIHCPGNCEGAIEFVLSAGAQKSGNQQEKRKNCKEVFFHDSPQNVANCIQQKGGLPLSAAPESEWNVIAVKRPGRLPSGPTELPSWRRWKFQW